MTDELLGNTEGWFKGKVEQVQKMPRYICKILVRLWLAMSQDSKLFWHVKMNHVSPPNLRSPLPKIGNEDIGVCVWGDGGNEGSRCSLRFMRGSSRGEVTAGDHWHAGIRNLNGEIFLRKWTEKAKSKEFFMFRFNSVLKHEELHKYTPFLNL